jgi:hypothetical protein
MPGIPVPLAPNLFQSAWLMGAELVTDRDLGEQEAGHILLAPACPRNFGVFWASPPAPVFLGHFGDFNVTIRSRKIRDLQDLSGS